VHEDGSEVSLDLNLLLHLAFAGCVAAGVHQPARTAGDFHLRKRHATLVARGRLQSHIML
jgi:hypothetical protein